MRIEDCVVGMRIVVGDSLERTKQMHSINSEMIKMKGKPYIIKHVNPGNNSVDVEGFRWQASDIRPVDVPDPDPIIFHFDPANL